MSLQMLFLKGKNEQFPILPGQQLCKYINLIKVLFYLREIIPY